MESQNPSPAHPFAVALSGSLALALAMGIGRFAFTPLLPVMQSDAGLSIAAGGWLASANYVGYLLGALSAIHVQTQPAIAVRIGLAAVGVSTLLMGCTHALSLWLGLRGVAGVASAWVLIFGSAWCLERLAAAHRTGLAGLVFGGVGFGIALAGMVCLVLMQHGVHSATAWMILGALCLVLTASLWPWFAPLSGASRAAQRAAAPRARVHPRFTGLILCYGAFGFGYIIPATFLPAMAKQIVHDPAVFGWAWPVFGAAAFFSTLLVSVLRRRFANRTVWISAQIVMALGVALPALSPGMSFIMASALLIGGTFVVITMVGIQEARAIAGAQSPALIAAMTSAFAAGQVAGPLLVSALAKMQAGLAVSLWIAFALLVLSAAALMRRREDATALADTS
jgi:predicted MFS family arabinose efflux permease